jgi:hypothetical protein
MYFPLKKCMDNRNISNANLDRFAMELSRAVGGPLDQTPSRLSNVLASSSEEDSTTL